MSDGIIYLIMTQVVNIDNLEGQGFSAEEIEDMRATVRHLKETGKLPSASEVITEFIDTQQLFPLQGEGMTVESFRTEEEATRFATDLAVELLDETR